jgi:hypothetical protein
MMLGDRASFRKTLIEKELLWLGKRQVDLERFHIGLVLGLATVC